VAAAAHLVGRHPDSDVVLVGHGTTWTLLDADVRDVEPDLDRWARLAMPDLLTCEVDVTSWPRTR
jgi:broad specificity phosphatase PhoE